VFVAEYEKVLVPADAEDVAVIITTDDPLAPGDMLKELGLGVLHTIPDGHEVALIEKVLDPHAELSLFVTLIVYVRSSPGFPVWLLGVIETVGFARVHEAADGNVVLDEVVVLVDPGTT
jgi:hypothetical protein